MTSVVTYDLCCDLCVSHQGHPRLVRALADTYGKVMDRSIDPNTDILVSVGAYGALFCAVQGLINPGDEASLGGQLVLGSTMGLKWLGLR